ncbi:general secretion pathway protein GspB [Desulfobacula sp.]|uniref:general secretion pathway protein GspB n=1 Tax=Desulfobacula sp. TaxID=2593537 RepID=UPI00262B7BCE|nr:general secretion pathway protein GspB [Desulfobacula sp.]
MSTILKALKRAEQDCPDPGDTNRSSVKLNIRTTLNSKLQRQKSRLPIRARQLVIPLCLALVITMGAYGLFFRGKVFQSHRPSLAPANPSSMTAPAALKDHPLTVQPPPTVLPDLPVPALPAPDLTAPDTRHQKTIKKPPELPEIKKRPSPTASPPSPPQPRSVPDAPPDHMDASPAPPDILPLAQGILKLQALSWAETPSERVVVINNRVLGEGESVEEYQIQRIEKDQVILQQSGQVYTLGFKYR